MSLTISETESGNFVLIETGRDGELVVDGTQPIEVKDQKKWKELKKHRRNRGKVRDIIGDIIK